MKNLSGLLAVLAFFLCASISYGQTNYVKRINCGDVNSTTHNGETYDADDGNGYTYTGDSSYTTGHSGFTLDTNPGEIFARTRYTKIIPSMQYDFPVQDGDYEVILHWAEPYHGPGLSGQAADYRQFDVQINGGILEEDNLKVFVEAGINTPFVKTYQVTASGGSGISIEFIDQNANDPIINAIEVLGVSPSSIPITGVTLNTSSVSLEINTTQQLTATVSPGNATDQTVSWSSSDDTKAIVSASGVVTAVAVGQATITVTTQDGNMTASSTISVSDSTPPSTSSGEWTKNDLTNNLYYTGGNVGIGTTNIDGWELAVGGEIRAEEIKVETGWADYVFSKDYNLPTLQEVEQHIQDKGHLINIPSAAEVEADGIKLGEMNKLLLEKIEELTLYILQDNKRVIELESLHKKLEAKLLKLENLNNPK